MEEQLLEENVTLVADGRQFLCNKGKLIASSDYFRAMFSNNFSEKDKDVVKLKDIDADCLHILLQYVETGSYNIDNDNILALLQTAAMLQFTDVQAVCEKEVFASLSCESCLETYSVTSSLGLSNIAVAARTIALWNFCKIVTMPQYLRLTLAALVEYLSDPALFTGPGGEWTVWESIISWITENEIERTCHIMQLLCCLDFKSLTVDDISNMLFYSIVSENDEVVQILECIKNYKAERVVEYEHLRRTDVQLDLKYDSSDDYKGVNSVNFYMNCLTRKAPLAPSVVGYKRCNFKRKKKAKTSDDEDDDFDTLSSKENLDIVPVLYTFNPSTGKVVEEFIITKLCEGPVVCSGYQVCSVGPSVYILGGEFLYGHGNWNNSLWRYSTVTRKWIVENALPKPRRHHMSCVVESVIYILGGFGRHRVVQSSVNAYDTESGDWIHCPDMPHCVGHGAACSFKGRVMVFTHEMQLLTYYPSMKKWSAIPLRSPSKHGYRAALTWKNSIYLIDNCSTKVYKYSPEEGQTVSEYGCFEVPPINVCIVDSKMYNFSHDGDTSCVIEVLDIIDNDQHIVKGSQGRECGAQGDCDDIQMKTPIEIDGDMQSDMISSVDSSFEHGKELKILDDRKMIVSTEIWRECADGPRIFTTKFPPDTTFSLGCFPLMKL